MRIPHYTRRHYHETAGGPTYPGMTCDGCGLVVMPTADPAPALGSRVLGGPVNGPAEHRPDLAVCPVDGRPCERAHGPP